jgi:DNA invertase Pin-like site-specific DNA recombinase
MKLVGMVRVSTDKQVGENGEGLERQRITVRETAKAVGATLSEADIIEVKGVSGSDVADTEAWKTKILPLIAQGYHIAVDAIDRLIRADGFDLRVLLDLRRAGSRIYAKGQVYDTLDKKDVFMLTIHAGVGGFEKSNIGDRTRAGKSRLRKEGKWPYPRCRLPMGLAYDKEMGWSYNGDAHKVKEAFKAVAEGATISSQGRMLGRTPQAVKRMIQNTMYRGVWEVLEGDTRIYSEEDQLVSDKLFEQVQKRSSTNGKDHRRQVERTMELAPYSGFLTSANEHIAEQTGYFHTDLADKVQHVMYGIHHVNGARYACRCVNGAYKANLSKCNIPQHRADWLNVCLNLYLEKLTREPDLIKAMWHNLNDNTEEKKTEKTMLEKAICKAQKRKMRLKDLYIDGDVDRADYDKRKVNLITEIEGLEQAIADLDNGVTVTREDLKAMLKDWIFKASWTATEIRNWCRKYVYSIRIGTDAIESISIRVPQAERDPIFVLGQRKNWIQLLGFDPRSRKAVDKAKLKNLQESVQK